jgi:membrane-bound serine protease (ClpP class)
MYTFSIDRVRSCVGVLAAVFVLAAAATPARAEGSGDRGFVLNVPSNLTTEWIEQKKKYINDLVNRFEKDRQLRDQNGKGVFKLVCDFNPNNQANSCDDYFACYKLADYLASLGDRKVRTIAFVHDEVTRHSVLPVLACSEIVMSAKPTGQGDKQRVPGFGRVNLDPNKTLPKAQQDTYLDLARSRYSAALIRKMFDFNLVVIKVRDVGKNGERYQDENAKPAPQGEYVPGLGKDAVAFYPFDRGKEFGLCQQTPLHDISDVLAEYGLQRNVNVYNISEVTNAWRVVVSGALETPLVESSKRHIDVALGKGANLVIVQLECGKGDSQAAVDFANYLLGLKAPDREQPVRTVAYVTKDASDTAAFVAFACDEMLFAEGAELNFEQYLGKNPGRETSLRDNLVKIASAQGYPEVLARGLLDKKLVVHEVVSIGGADSQRKFMSQEELDAERQKEKPQWTSRGIVKPLDRNDPDKYLVLTPDTARTLRLIGDDGVVAGEQAVYEHYGLDAKNVKQAGNDWLDAIGDFLRNPWVGVFLVGIGILCLILELKMPGVSLPGVIAAVCFVLFFWAHSQGTIGLLAILLFILGLVLIAVEIFLLPGFTAPGVVGVLLIIGSIGMAAYGHWPRSSDDWVGFGKTLSPFGISIFIAIVGAFVAARYLPSIPYANRLILKPPGHPAAEGEEPGPPVETVRAELAALLGAIGVAATPLRPAGKVQFGDQFVDVVAEGSFVQPGTRVQVVEIEGNRVVVKEV